MQACILSGRKEMQKSYEAMSGRQGSPMFTPLDNSAVKVTFLVDLLEEKGVD
jgi:hypothetical protein